MTTEAIVQFGLNDRLNPRQFGNAQRIVWLGKSYNPLLLQRWYTVAGCLRTFDLLPILPRQQKQSPFLMFRQEAQSAKQGE